MGQIGLAMRQYTQTMASGLFLVGSVCPAETSSVRAAIHAGLPLTLQTLPSLSRQMVHGTGAVKRASHNPLARCRCLKPFGPALTWAGGPFMVQTYGSTKGA